MKLKLKLITSALAASCFCLHAEVPQAGVTLPPVVVYAPAQGTPKANGHVYQPEKSSTELIGVEVWNLQNEKLGKIKFITADLEHGRLLQVGIASGGGWFGFGGKTTPVPPGALKLDAAGDVMRLDMSKTRFDATPSFQSARQGKVKTTEAILGTPIHNTQGQYLGQVGNLIMDLPSGRILQVVNDTQAMGGDGSHAIAPQSLRYNPKHTRLVMDQSFAQLQDQPIFKWADGSHTAFQLEYADGKTPVRSARQANALTPGQQGRDAQKTSRIELALKTHAKHVPHTSNVKVVTLNAQTTLRGHVSTIAGKRQIGAIAAQEGKPGQVSNLLVVAALTPTPAN